MTQQKSMARRLVIAITSVVTVFWLVAAGICVIVMQGEFAEVFDSALQETTERLLPLVVDELKAQMPSDIPRELEPKRSGRREYLTYQVRGADGAVMLRSHDAPKNAYEAPLKVGFFNTRALRVYTVGTPDGSLYIQVADAFKNRREAVRESGMALIWPLLVLIPASIFAILWIVKRTLMPVQTLRDDIASKDGGNMVPVDEAALPIELNPIARSVNLLLDRLRSALEAEREFTSNSAHELRTPIAGALAQTQRLIEEIPPEAVPRARQIERSLSQLGRLAEKLLQLSRAEAGIGVTETATDLLPVMDIIIQDMERSAIGHGRIAVHRDTDASLIRAVSPDAFAIVIRNLLENALIHSPAGGVIDVFVEADGVIRIRNRCAVVEETALAGLTARFARGLTDAAGSGLGLSIVKRFVEQMDGKLALSSPAADMADGFEAKISL